MRIAINLILATLLAGLLAACGTYSQPARDAGREVRNENGYTTMQQSIRF